MILVKSPFTLFTATDCVSPPVNPEPVGASHVYVVPVGIIPFTPSVGVTTNVIPLQVTVVIAAIEAAGLMVTVTVNTDPVQTPEIGVTR